MNKVREYLQKNAQFIYSTILVILIPVFIIINALWQIRSTNNQIDRELQSQALLVESVLGSAINESVTNPTLLQNKITQIAQDNPNLGEITVLSPSTNDFIVTASTDNQNIGLKPTSEDYISVYLQDKPTTKLLEDTTKSPPERFWQVTATLKNSDGEKVALVNMTLSLKEVDAQNKKNLNTSLIILAATVFLVLLLLINHFRFFESTVMFNKLKEVDKMKDDFISIATHEMKTPMAATKGYISMLFEGVAGTFDQKTKTHLEKIYVNIQRLDTLLSETLDVSRLEQNRMQFDMQPYDISAIVSQSIASLQDQAESKGLKLTETKLNPMPLVFIDPERLRQVIDNLISNAIKYTQKGGVSLSYQTEGGKLNLIIKDTGIGMNTHDRNNLFTQFYRIKNEKTVDIPGTGLGLWISREITKKMNGEIRVESTENVGSTFTLQFPFIKDK